VREQFVSEIPAGRIGEGEEAAELVLAWLPMPAASWRGSDPDLRRVGYLIQDGSGAGGAVSLGRSGPLAGLPSLSRLTL
jgi:hypothetical protein